MMLALALALAGVGFAALALAMPRHHRELRHRKPSPRLRLLLRSVGAAGLLASFAATVAHAGWRIGPVWWFGLGTVAAWVVTLAITFYGSNRRHS